MRLTLTRTRRPHSTPGVLAKEGNFFCYTLEDPGDGAIPVGMYEIAVTFSARFQRPMPLLLHVPGRTGIRIHSGNTVEDTSGCILVGHTRHDDWVGDSRVAYTNLFYAIQKALKGAKVWIEIIDATP